MLGAVYDDAGVRTAAKAMLELLRPMEPAPRTTPSPAVALQAVMDRPQNNLFCTAL